MSPTIERNLREGDDEAIGGSGHGRGLEHDDEVRRRVPSPLAGEGVTRSVTDEGSRRKALARIKPQKLDFVDREKRA